jgi:hypothetical protein
MLTSESIQNAERSCLDRFGKRFEGFEPIPIEVVARAKWAEYRAKEVTRAELENWLAEQEDEQVIRGIFNGLRGWRYQHEHLAQWWLRMPHTR